MAEISGSNGNDNIGAAKGVTNGNDTVFGHGGDDIIHGLGGDDTIFGGTENDWLYGDGEDDTLYGGSGHDWLMGGSGADHLDGGSGSDMAMYGGSPVGVVVSLATGAGYNGHAEGDTLVLIEHVAGSSHDDILVGNGGSNTLYGYGGHDTLKGGGGVDALYGYEHNDVLEGGAGADTLDGGSGSDTAFYGGSASSVTVHLNTGIALGGDAQGNILVSIENLTGSGSSDELEGDDANNVLDGLDGMDVLRGWGGFDHVYGGENTDWLYGGDGNDTLYGQNGNDWLIGDTGFDTMIGGFGNDLYFVDSQNDTLTELPNQGIDTVYTTVNWGLPAGASIERLRTLDEAGMVPISLNGNSYDNEIIGNNGDNVINGHGGADHMVGHGGNDIYFVDNAGDSVAESGGEGQDTVYASVNFTLTFGADVETLATTDDSGTAALTLQGNSTGNLVRGNNGNNIIGGRGGADTLMGLGGEDWFSFNTQLDAATHVVLPDFNPAEDTILLENAVFGALGGGTLAAGRFVNGAAAQDADDHIIYNAATGALLYDSDGAGGTAAIQFAEVTPGLGLTHLDIYVV